jgi:hypothetical protein
MAVSFARYNSDFFQRAGLLKLLVAVLDHQRRSTALEALTRKLSQLLFEPAGGRSRAEHLIRKAGGPSWNFLVTEPNVKQVVEWGRLVGFVGSGNQITEKGLMLRAIMGPEALESITSGDLGLNPFELTAGEKLYLLYVHWEVDSALHFLLRRIASLQPEEAIRGIEADKLTCLAFYDLFHLMSESRNNSKILLTLKSLRELIARMVMELDLLAEIPIKPAAGPKPMIKFRQKPEQRDKKRTKTADREAIPRFELLVDLGLLTKKVDEEDRDEEKARKSWKYWPAMALADFFSKMPDGFDSEFCQSGFARCASTLVSANAERLDVERDAALILRSAYDAYSVVRRRFGHTPVESVAVLTMINALAESKVVEVKDVYQLFLGFKMNNLFPDTVRYAAGNDLKKMFIDIKPSFVAEVDAHYGKQ